MKRLPGPAVLIGLLLWAAAARCELSVDMSGDVCVFANAWSRYQYTGWNFNGTRTYDPLTVWERLRVQTDFKSGQNLNFRLGVRIDDGPGKSPWGSGAFTLDNPAPALEIYQAYLQFNWPCSDVQFTIGYQDFNLPVSIGWMSANPVLGATTAGAAVMDVPVIKDVWRIDAGFTRLLDSNKDFDPSTTQKADELDAYFLFLPVSTGSFSVTPWGMVAVAGRDSGYFSTTVGNGPNSGETLASNLLSAGNFASGTSRNALNAYWWAGTALAVTALDPFRLYGDAVYGSGNDAERGSNRRGGFFFDAAAEYAGFDFLTPQLTFWYSSGEDKAMSNGSERLPCVVDYWGPSNSFLFDSSQEFHTGFMGVNPVGSSGVVAGLDKVTFVPDLTHRLVFSYARGTNSPAGLRTVNLAAGVGQYVQMGRDLTTRESVMGVNIDTRYDIRQNLAAVLETGWSRGVFQTSVWTARFTHQARGNDAWKVAVGLKYSF